MALVARTYRDPLSTEEGGSVMLAHHNRRCSWGLKPPVSRSDRAT